MSAASALMLLRYSTIRFGAANFATVVEKPQHCFALKTTDFLQ